jgi:hypothetical protein
VPIVALGRDQQRRIQQLIPRSRAVPREIRVYPATRPSSPQRSAAHQPDPPVGVRQPAPLGVKKSKIVWMMCKQIGYAA